MSLFEFWREDFIFMTNQSTVLMWKFISKMADSNGVVKGTLPFSFFKKIPKVVSLSKNPPLKGNFNIFRGGRIEIGHMLIKFRSLQ